MSQKDENIKEKRVVQAPQAGNPSMPNSVLSVELSDDEEVEWQWTHFPDGQSIVTGYKIVKKRGD